MSTAAVEAAANCAYCGLPVRSSAAPVYCCFGCRFAADMQPVEGKAGWNSAALARLGLAIFFTLNVLMFTMVLWSPDVYGAQPESRFAQVLHGLFRHLCAVLALIVFWLLGFPLLENAWGAWRQGTLTTDWLLLAGVLAAYAVSLHSTWSNSGPIYFEVGCVVLVLVTLGRWLEATGKQKALATLSHLEHWLPRQVRQVRNGEDTFCPTSEVVPGMLLKVLAGERIPVDGIIEAQTITLDEQWLTGESLPVAKEPGRTAFGGTLVAEGTLFLRVAAGSGEGAFSRYLELVRAALSKKGRYQRLADRLTQWFLPLVLMLAIAATLVHAKLFGVGPGILAGLGVVLIACPCALGLATPLAVWTAISQAAERQLLIKSPTALEELAKVQIVYFDKTGTLTQGTPRLAASHFTQSADREYAIAAARWLASHSTHPLSLALKAGLHAGMLLDPEPTEPKSQPGRGICAQSPAGAIFLGNFRAMQEMGRKVPSDLAEPLQQALTAGNSIVLLSLGPEVVALFQFEESLRVEATSCLAELRGEGLRVAVLTGDHSQRAANLARRLEVPVQGELLPEQKVSALRQEQAKKLAVAMIGDGLNDAPALAAANVGIALGCGPDLSRDSADVCLLSSDLKQLPWLFRLGRETERTIQRNLFWALIYNVLGMGLAVFGILNPVLAAAAMAASSLFVIGNTLRLRRVSKTKPEPNSHPQAVAG